MLRHWCIIRDLTLIVFSLRVWRFKFTISHGPLQETMVCLRFFNALLLLFLAKTIIYFLAFIINFIGHRPDILLNRRYSPFDYVRIWSRLLVSETITALSLMRWLLLLLDHLCFLEFLFSWWSSLLILDLLLLFLFLSMKRWETR